LAARYYLASCLHKQLNCFQAEANALLGHSAKSNMQHKKYVAPDRRVDIAGLRHGGIEDISLIEAKSSVGFERGQSAWNPDIADLLKRDGDLRGLLELHQQAKVRAQEIIDEGDSEVHRTALAWFF
jgi:hypothetical protein